MAWTPEFRDHVLDLLGGIDGVSARSMFGGVGIFAHGRMFALIADDRLYFKEDEDARPLYDAEGCAYFEYEARGRRMRMGYREAPAVVFEDPEMAERWGRVGLEAASRSAE